MEMDDVININNDDAKEKRTNNGVNNNNNSALNADKEDYDNDNDSRTTIGDTDTHAANSINNNNK